MLYVVLPAGQGSPSAANSAAAAGHIDNYVSCMHAVKLYNPAHYGAYVPATPARLGWCRFTAALEGLPQSSATPTLRRALLANRSLASLNASRVKDALVDARVLQVRLRLALRAVCETRTAMKGVMVRDEAASRCLQRGTPLAMVT